MLVLAVNIEDVILISERLDETVRELNRYSLQIEEYKSAAANAVVRVVIIADY
jgi:hypothetical protein